MGPASRVRSPVAPSPFLAAVHTRRCSNSTIRYSVCTDRSGSCSMEATQEDEAAVAVDAAAEASSTNQATQSLVDAAAEASSTNQATQSLKGCSRSMEIFYPNDSPLKKRKSHHDLVDPGLLSLKYKFRKRLSRQEEESATTESLGCDSFSINMNCGTDMVSIPEEVDSCENTLSLFGGYIEVDSRNGVESQSMRKMSEARASGSSISSNIYSTDVSSFRSTGTKETDSWILHDDETYKPHANELDMMYDVLEQYGDPMDGELACGDFHSSASHAMDEKLYSNGVDDFQILPTGQTSSPGVKKLTIDQEFEQYFSRLML